MPPETEESTPPIEIDQTEPISTIKPESLEQGTKNTSMIQNLIFIVIGGIAAGLLYYLKVKKPNNESKVETNLDEQDFDQEDDIEDGYGSQLIVWT